MSNLESFIKETSYEHVMSSGDIDGYSNYIGIDWSGWLCGPSRSRDSDVMVESNFESILEYLGGEQEGIIEVRHCSHWACGWLDQIMVKVSAMDKVELLHKVHKSLEDYPIFDDSDYSERLIEAMYEEFKAYRSDFVREIGQFIGKEIDINDERYETLARAIYEEDVSYRGFEDAFVDKNSIERFLDSYEAKDFPDQALLQELRDANVPDNLVSLADKLRSLKPE